MAFLDISTGEFLTGEGTQDYVEKLLGNFSPKEVLYDRTKKQEFERNFGNRFFTFQMDDWVFTEDYANDASKIEQQSSLKFHSANPFHKYQNFRLFV